jgi:flagellar biosynthesis/type III secretory pathway protein FliH
MIEDIMKESSFYEIVLEEGIEKGIEQGIEQGIEKGRAEGQLGAMRQLARDALSARFGALNETLAEQISKLTDTDVLRQLILDAPKFPDMPAVVALVDAAKPAE